MTVPRIKSTRNKDKKNRGKELQEYISRNLERLQSLGSLIYVEIEIKMKKIDGKIIYDKKQHCDFVVSSKKGNFWLDSKECGKNSFSISGKRIKRQAESFSLAQKMGNKAGFLVWFYKEDETKTNVRFVEDFSKPITIESGIKFDWDMFI